MAGVVRTIVTYPAAVLRAKCARVSEADFASGAVAALAADLIATARHSDGLGLAAPQVIIAARQSPSVVATACCRFRSALVCVVRWFRGAGSLGLWRLLCVRGLVSLPVGHLHLVAARARSVTTCLLLVDCRLVRRCPCSS
jgi:hypothetical protein